MTQSDLVESDRVLIQTAELSRKPEPTQSGGRATNYRWLVVALLFFAITINYIDRAVLGVLKPLLGEKLGWDQKDYGWMVTAFQATYAAGYLLAGRLVDRLGVRVGLWLAVSAWSVAAMAHALARTVLGFSTARASLGLAECACFPAAIKAITEWFPKEQRALATGIFNAGSPVGAMSWRWNMASPACPSCRCACGWCGNSTRS